MFRQKLNQSSTPTRQVSQSSMSLRPKTGPMSAASKRTSSFIVNSRNRSMNQSELQSSVATDSGPEHLLSEYGTQTPLAVTEALTLQPKRSKPSAKLEQNGWVWIVCGRKAFIWNFQNTPVNKVGNCFELLLPASDLGHCAELVTVFESNRGNGFASCLSITPSGNVRYWDDISLENSYTELSIGSHGDEAFAFLTTLHPPEQNCIVATSAGTLMHICLNEMKYRIMKPAHGMLSGIGRRVSSFFFGGSQHAQSSSGSSPICQLLAGETLNWQLQSLYVLTEDCLQKWAVSSDQEKLLYESPVENMFREHLSNAVWKKDPQSLTKLSVWLMDIQLVRDGVMILGAGVNHESSDEVYFALGLMQTEGEVMPQSLLTFTVTGHHTVYEKDNEAVLWHHLLVPNLSSLAVFLYSQSTIACVVGSKPDDPPDVVDFNCLGAGCCDGVPVFVSAQGQLVKIQETRNEFMANAVEILSKTASFSKLDTSIVATTNLEAITRMSGSSEPSSRLKAAFLMSIRAAAHQLDVQLAVEDLFSVVSTPSREPGSLLDRLVISLSQEMVDDYPASDPRWAESLPSGSMPTSASLILLHQLDDKLKAHQLFLNFLKTYGLWNRLTLSVVRDSTMATRLLLCEHAEKIEAAKALRNRHNDNAELVGRAIEMVLDRRSVEPVNNLTPQDLFYREVSKVHEIMPVLIECEEEQLMSETDSRAVVTLVSAVNNILKDMIFAATNYRLAEAPLYQSTVPLRPEPEFIAWTSSLGPRGVRPVLSRQFEVTVERGLAEAQSGQDRGVVSQQMLDLSDMLLDGYRVQLDSLKARFGSSNQRDPHYVEVFRKYEQERAAVIRPFMIGRQYERATALAEKYCDFATLVQLCDELNNPERLQMYMEKFHNEGFSDFVYQWHMSAGKRGKLLKSDFLLNPSLKSFLQTRENKYLSWLYDISANDYMQAHNTLFELGREETEFLGKKKTLLSLSKLAALASGVESNEISLRIDEINQEQDLILHQEQLMSSPNMQESLGVQDPDNMKVLSVAQQIDLYIGEYNVGANEFDFKKALDLLSFVDKTNSDFPWNETLLQIWSKAILCDGWNHSLSTTDPIENCRDTVFYKTLELVLAEDKDGNTEELLPDVDELLSSEFLGQLRHRSDFQCLLRAVYEHIHRMT